MWLGQGRHFLAFPVRAGKLINYVGFVPTDEEMKESWSAPGDPEILRRAFAGWDPRIQQLLGEVQVTFRWALYDREPLPVWTRQRLSLLGDAAHPMLPHLGQGANQSIEDGIALATILARADTATAPSALLAYERLRRERVAQVHVARENGMRWSSMRTRAFATRDCRSRCIPQTALRPRCGAGSAGRRDGPYVVRAAIDVSIHAFTGSTHVPPEKSL
jgi:salicylate hydroxylase